MSGCLSHAIDTDNRCPQVLLKQSRLGIETLLELPINPSHRTHGV